MVADGLDGLRLLNPDTSAERAHVPLDFGFGHGLEVERRDDDSHRVAQSRMGWGAQLYSLDADGLSIVTNKVPLGAVSSSVLAGE